MNSFYGLKVLIIVPIVSILLFVFLVVSGFIRELPLFVLVPIIIAIGPGIFASVVLVIIRIWGRRKEVSHSKFYSGISLIFVSCLYFLSLAIDIPVNLNHLIPSIKVCDMIIASGVTLDGHTMGYANHIPDWCSWVFPLYLVFVLFILPLLLFLLGIKLASPNKKI